MNGNKDWTKDDRLYDKIDELEARIAELEKENQDLKEKLEAAQDYINTIVEKTGGLHGL